MNSQLAPPAPEPLAPQPIGAMLVARSLITTADLDKALAFQRQFGGRLGSILVRMGALSEDSLLPVLAEQTGLSLVGPESLPSGSESTTEAIAATGLSPEWFADQGLAVWETPDGVIHCAARNPLDSFLHEAVSLALGDRSHAWHFVRNQDLEQLLKFVEAGARAEQSDEVAHLRELAEEAPVIELVNNVMAQAIDEGASDIHIEPEESAFAIRFRIDGVLHTRMSLPRSRFDAVASRIKLVCGMDIAERRLPQDGRITVRAGGADMDIRVSALPGVHGESIVTRLLPKERKHLSLEWLGMESDHHDLFRRWVDQPNGIILVTGPTGSGKSTTLYAALDATNDHTKKIITVEDPVEYRLSGVTQVQTQAEIGYTFARALRSILRQDPDVIMIGEIRDLETAEIAVQSSLTGHLVLSTLHTNDALSAFTRLLDMGVEPFLVASAVRAVQAQRLVRRLCDACASPGEAPAVVAAGFEALRAQHPTVFSEAPNWRLPRGCPSCRGTGYRGRTGIYEMVAVTPAIESAIMERATAADLTTIARAEGYRNLREDGIAKAARGLTSVDEVLRVAGAGGTEA